MKAPLLLILSGLVAIPFAYGQQSPVNTDFSPVLNTIGNLEDKSDPKCYATASRLEDFIYGTPLTDEARFGKIELQKKLILSVWSNASKKAGEAGLDIIDKKTLSPVLNDYLTIKLENSGDWLVVPPLPQRSLTINADAKRQYSSIAYSLRAILAVQQDSLLTDTVLLPMDDEAIEYFRLLIDLYTMSALQLADKAARDSDKYEVSLALLEQGWKAMDKNPAPVEYTLTANDLYKKPSFEVTNYIINRKIASYETYNQITSKVFLRNLQVYFARATWPKSAEEGEKFKQLFNELMINFTIDLYKGAEQFALKEKKPFIRVEDVKHFSTLFIPHKINEFEDALFFPRLSYKEQIYIEAYDMDAFRDSGMHWRYLQWALESPEFKAQIPLDPFSSELIVENVAQFGVLALRIAGEQSKKQGDGTLKAEHLEAAAQIIQGLIEKNVAAKEAPVQDKKLASSAAADKDKADFLLFDDIGEQLGFQFEHRTADWLSRLIRSYSMRDQNTGVLDIPPAFGGSGVAAEDINNDGYPDLLILGGRGNKLYLNKGKDGLKDITESAGLEWRRKDGTPGEPRQPLIADLNNDGLQDIVITYVNDKHRVYQNIDGTTFKDITDQVNLGGENTVGGPATVFDFDNDGLLDIYIANFGDYIHGTLPTLARRNFNGLSNHLYRNKGNFVFEDVTEKMNADNTGWGQAISHTDIDGDGWQDLIVGNDFGVNAYLRNIEGKRFENIADDIGTGKPSFTMSVGLGDLNDDEIPDVYISNIVTMNKDQKYVLPSEETQAIFNPKKLAKMRIAEANDLFLSSKTDGLPAYELSDLVGRGYSSTGWAWGADFFDADNDADDDLYVVNGMNEYAVYSDESYVEKGGYANDREIFLPVSEKETNVFFQNADGKLNNVSKGSGLDILVNSRSAAYFDIDLDGDLDIALNNYHAPAHIFRNNAEKFKNHSLSIRLIGDPAKKTSVDAIGARVIATLPDGNKVWREIHGSVGYLTVHPKEQFIGTGKHKTVDLLVIWPNGERQVFKSVKVGKRYELHQSADLKIKGDWLAKN